MRRGTWVAHGFGSDSMPRTDVHYIEYKSNGKFEVHDAFCYGYSTPEDDTALNGTYDIHNITSTISSGFLTLSYTRPMQTNDKYDRDITTDYNYIIVAWGEGKISYHSDYRYVTSFNFRQLFEDL